MGCAMLAPALQSWRDDAEYAKACADSSIFPESGLRVREVVIEGARVVSMKVIKGDPSVDNEEEYEVHCVEPENTTTVVTLGDGGIDTAAARAAKATGSDLPSTPAQKPAASVHKPAAPKHKATAAVVGSSRTRRPIVSAEHRDQDAGSGKVRKSGDFAPDSDRSAHTLRAVNLDDSDAEDAPATDRTSNKEVRRRACPARMFRRSDCIMLALLALLALLHCCRTHSWRGQSGRCNWTIPTRRTRPLLARQLVSRVQLPASPTVRSTRGKNRRTSR